MVDTVAPFFTGSMLSAALIIAIGARNVFAFSPDALQLARVLPEPS